MDKQIRVGSQKRPFMDWANMNPVLGFGDDACFGLLQQQLHPNQSVQRLNTQLGTSRYLDSQLEKQRQGIDQFLHLQNERLRLALHGRRNEEIAIILKSMESRVVKLIMQKEGDLAEATSKSKDLENSLKRVEMEKEAWQRVAKESESKVINLKNTLRQVLKEGGSLLDDAESSVRECSSEFIIRGDRGEEMAEEGKTGKGMNMACKWCNGGRACVVFFPCKHLCSCKECETFLGQCPVCKCIKRASMEVFLAF